MKAYTMTEEMKTVALDLPNLEHEESIKPSREELMIVLRSLERQGLIVSYLGSDGQVRWCFTEKGKHTKPSDADDYFYPVS
jgi:hypothetical protein